MTKRFVIMPKMSGLYLLGQVKDKYKNKIKVVMVSVADDEATQAQALSLGADGFVRKPFDADYLQEVVMAKIEELVDPRFTSLS